MTELYDQIMDAYKGIDPSDAEAIYVKVAASLQHMLITGQIKPEEYATGTWRNYFCYTEIKSKN